MQTEGRGKKPLFKRYFVSVKVQIEKRQRLGRERAVGLPIVEIFGRKASHAGRV